jgi:nucleotide-binding universal stress UspA family protein
MKLERILLPLDVRKCPLEIFATVEGFARRPKVTLILLHVIHLDTLAAETRSYREVSVDARGYLGRLAEQFVHPITSTLLHIRVGKPSEQILEEAKTEKAELIVLPTYGPSFRTRLVSIWRPGSCRMVSALAESIIRDSTCAVFLAGVKTRFNCEKQWGQTTRKHSLAPGGLRRSAEVLRLKAQANPDFAFGRSKGSR